MNREIRANVMILGSGGREDALAWRLRQSPSVGNIFIAPGNGGTERFTNTSRVHLNPKDSFEVIQSARDLGANLVIIGPEDPLVAGLADRLREENIATYGPGKTGAMLEGSKGDAVEFMEEFGIPHPASNIFNDFDSAAKFIGDTSWWKSGGVVVKADGLAAGKGVFVCDTQEEAEEGLERIMRDKEFGESGDRVVIQEKLKGYEASIMAIVSGEKYILLPTSEDHKQIYDDDKGSNTGGMGVLAPHPLITDKLSQQIEETIIQPTIHGLKVRGINFKGTLYPGIMVTEEGPKVLEYNVRFGDPETEAVLPLLDGDLFPVLKSAAGENLLFDSKYPTKGGYCLAVTLASAGYPGKYEKGKEIYGLGNVEEGDNVVVYHAGTGRRDDGVYETVGGRVLMVTGLGEDIEKARDAAYGVIGENGIHFDGMQYRNDIGARKRK